jgi:hypothetical protein
MTEMDAALPSGDARPDWRYLFSDAARDWLPHPQGRRLPNRSGMQEVPAAQRFLEFSTIAKRTAIHVRFIAILKLPFKFYGPSSLHQSRSGMIPKSGYRFSEQIMPNKRPGEGKTFQQARLDRSRALDDGRNWHDDDASSGEFGRRDAGGNRRQR